jgi:molybdopterin converting factor small subunit
MDTAVVTGAFTLGGVALGAAVEWLRSAGVARSAAVRERDELFVAMGGACSRLLVAARTWRNLNKVGAKLRQAAYGAMESEARRPFRVGDDAMAVARQLAASAVVNGLRYLFPVNVAETVRTDLLPLLSEVAVLAIRLSITGDEELKEAATRIGDTTGALVEHMAAREGDYAKREADVNAALGQLRRARDAAASRRRPGRRSIATTP